MIVHLDFETYSSVDIKKCGAHKYVSSPDFQILLCGCSVGDTAPVCTDLTTEEGKTYFDTVLLPFLLRPDVTIYAYNATFEALCIARAAGIPLTREYAHKFRCVMLHGMYAGYPAGLDVVGRALGLPEDKKKLGTGKALIRYFCVPCVPTKVNGGRLRNLPKHDPQRWELFKTYNVQDVVTEMEVEKRLAHIPVPNDVQKGWETDFIINARGVGVDMELVEGALDIGARVRAELLAEAQNLTGLNNPNSVQQLKAWLEKETEQEIDGLDKNVVAKMLQREDNSLEVQRALEIRRELGKTSTKKYDAIQRAVCDDGRVHGMLQYYGANRTGRFAGRFVQLQNLPRTYLNPLELARDLVKAGNGKALELVYGSAQDTLSQLIRTAFVAKPGNVLIDADFSAIEARVIAWLANEEWVLEVFRTHGKVYEATASQMFGVPIEKIKKGNPEYSLRQKGKVATLALGYQGSSPALIAMGALDVGIPEEELPDIVTRWRNSNKRIVQLWWAMQEAALRAIKTGETTVVNKVRVTREYYAKENADYLTIKLPSGRKLYYNAPVLGTNRWGGASISYLGVNQETKKWGRIETYGGKLVENVVQAIARDCLCEAIEKVEAAGLPVAFHIHDELVIDTKPFADDETMLKKVVEIMTRKIPWAPDLPLGADGWVGKYFKKD